MTQDNNDFVDAAAKLDAEIMEESVALARLQQARVLINHVPGTAAKINAERMEESTAMVCSQLEMGLINHVAGDVNCIFSGDRGGLGG